MICQTHPCQTVVTWGLMLPQILRAIAPLYDTMAYSPQVRNEPKKPSFSPVVRAVVQVEAWKFQAACRTQKSICMPNIKWIGLEIWKLDKKFYWNFWFQFYAEVRQGLLLTFKGLLEPWYSNPVFNSLKTHLIPNFIKIRPHLAKWEHFEV